MNNLAIKTNRVLEQAYQGFAADKLNHSIGHFEQALSTATSEALKINIKLIIALLYQKTGNYHLSLDYIKNLPAQKNKVEDKLLYVKIYANFTMIQVLNGNYTIALDYFQQLLAIIQFEKDLNAKKQLIQFATFIFFRVKQVEDISEKLQNVDFYNIKLEEVHSIWLLAFNSQLCKISQQKIHKKCYDYFIQYKRYDLAALSLRSLIKFGSQKNRESYEKQLGKIIMMGYCSEDLNFHNFQPYDIIQCIADQFILFRQKNIEQIQDQLRKSSIKNSIVEIESDQVILIEWKITISLILKEFKSGKSPNQVSKETVGLLSTIKQQSTLFIIKNMMKNSIFKKYNIKVKLKIKKLKSFSLKSLKNYMKQSFQKIRQTKKEQGLRQDFNKSNITHSRISIKASSRTKSSVKTKEDKQNHQPLGISVVSITSSKTCKQRDISRKKIFDEQANSLKTILKMVKFCQYGGFLNKRNFNSEGGQFKFVKINANFIKWGKDPEKIDKDCNMYPLKDIKSIVYGRVTPNLNENSNKMLSYSKCFSLVFQKRTLDFYCKDYQQLMAWVCGLTYALKKYGVNVVGYTPGKLRWKIMFAILKENFIQQLKTPERNKYYFQNAYALKLFAKNGYKLPNKH